MRVRLPPTAKFFQVFSSILELSPPPFMKEYEEICEKYEGIWRDVWKIKKYGGNMKEIWKNATLYMDSVILKNYRHPWDLGKFRVFQRGGEGEFSNSESFLHISNLLFIFSPYFIIFSTHLFISPAYFFIFFTYSPSLCGSSQLCKFWDLEKFRDLLYNVSFGTWENSELSLFM